MIATSNCNAAKDLVSLFANGERVTALRLELLPGASAGHDREAGHGRGTDEVRDRDQGVLIEG